MSDRADVDVALGYLRALLPGNDDASLIELVRGLHALGRDSVDGLRDRLGEVCAERDRWKEAAHAHQQVNADEVIAKRTNLLARIEVAEAERDTAREQRDEAFGSEGRLLADRDRLLDALGDADEALRDARDGLDLGLGFARDARGDDDAIPSHPDVARIDDHLRRARSAHRAVRAALGRDDP